MSDKDISKKIDVLFSYRKIPIMMEASGIQNKNEFIKQLKALQLTIYHLDAYLEANWETKKTELNQYWKEIYTVLDYFGVRKKDRPEYVKNIQSYQARELGLRNGKLPLQFSFNNLYQVKSCDVKLIRKLIYLHAPSLKGLWAESDWRFYDLITEVNDDIDDLYEDLDTYNCNRFLIGLHVEGKKRTGSLYRNYIKEIKRKHKTAFKNKVKDPSKEKLFKWTEADIKNTTALLDKRLKAKKTDGIGKAVLFEKLILSK